MRAAFARALPRVELHPGSAEAIPLADGGFDVVTAGQAFHWFETQRALAEMHRVTRPGGGFALTWNRWTEDDPILNGVQLVLQENRSKPAPWRDEYLDGLFGPIEQRTFDERRLLTADALVAWAASTSPFVTAPAAQQADFAHRIREVVGAPEAEVTVSTLVVVADRA